MNANPSGSRTPPTGCWGRSKARRELEAAAEPSSGHARVDGPAGKTGGTDRRVPGSVGGTRHAMKVCRGALNVMRAAQGRVGDLQLPRHIARHLVPHRLLSANTSAPADAGRASFPVGAYPRFGKHSAGPELALRRAAQPGSGRSPRLEASDTDLVHTRYDVTSTSACELSRGKGVLAA